jgi:hypothetical protein
MRVGTIYYNENTDTTEVKWADHFAVDHRITKLDVLKDIQGITWMAYDYVHEDHDDSYIPQTLQG